MTKQDKTEAVLELAQKAWEDYAFPDDVQIEGADGWGPYDTPFIGDVQISRVFYVQGEDPDADSQKCYFSAIVDSEGMMLKEAYATTQNGNDFGSLNPQPSLTR